MRQKRAAPTMPTGALCLTTAACLRARCEARTAESPPEVNPPARLMRLLAYHADAWRPASSAPAYSAPAPKPAAR
ncbi:hypothetical protein [Streptomyces alboflavus]|uniref:hypothetical protein n=1 Tax=Streptomyces alboflavus TaxID=67267 RepID=UPI0013316F9C|nr:hypothetical protein [Streptomyces alboflavus]